MRQITVPEVAALLGVTLDNKTAWSIGSRMATRYAQTFGAQPPKDNRPKTKGPGSHCFALYPASWEPLIRSEIQSHINAQRNQFDMFGDEIDNAA